MLIRPNFTPLNWNLSIAYPWWFILLCLLVGFLYAGILYYKSKNSDSFLEHKWAKVVLPIARFLTASLLIFYLLSPILKFAGYITQKPMVTLLVDNSASVGSKNKGTKVGLLRDRLTSFSTSLKEKFDVEVLSFSNIAQPTEIKELDFKGSETSISGALRYVERQYVNQNLGAVVLVSDGIYNAGNNVAQTSLIKYPVYTVSLGDTTAYSDLSVNNVSHNSIAYLGNDFPFRIEVKALKLAGKQAKLKVYNNGSLIDQKNVNLNFDNFFFETDVITTAKKIGQNKISIVLNSFEDEHNTDNNVYHFYVDVIDAKKNVAIWAEGPHPDIGLLNSVINKNEKYQSNIKLKKYEIDSETDLVILHNWFQNGKHLNLFQKLRERGIPTLIVIGNKFNERLFNAGSHSLNFNRSGRTSNAVLAALNPSFEYFEISEELKSQIKKWPPLNAPFGNFTGFRRSNVVFKQTIGSVKTEEPLLLLSSEGKTRLGLIAGSGIWQWRLNNFETTGGHLEIEELVTKMVQYLAVKEEKKLLNVYPSSKQYGVGESVTILGELYNQSLDAISNAEINLDLKNKEGKTFKHTLSASGKQYRLLVKNLEEGTYRFSAKAKVGGVELKDNGYFSIMGQQKEFTNLTANHQLLKNVSAATGGLNYNLTDLSQLSDHLIKNKAIKSVISEENRLEELINFKWIFWLIIALLSVEWFVRKWVGGY